MLALAVPAALFFGLLATESAVVNAVLAALPLAKESIAAFSIYHRVFFFALQPLFAIAVAMLPFAARRFAEGDAASVRAAFRAGAAAIGAYVAFVVAPAALAAAPRIASRLAEVPATREFATFALRLVPLGGVRPRRRSSFAGRSSRPSAAAVRASRLPSCATRSFGAGRMARRAPGERRGPAPDRGRHPRARWLGGGRLGGLPCLDSEDARTLLRGAARRA